MPHTRLFPTLRYDDLDAAVEWLTDVLNFDVSVAARTPDGTLVHAQLRGHGGAVLLGRSDDTLASPRVLGGVSGGVYLVVDDVQEWHRRLIEQRVDIAVPLTPAQHGWSFSCRDPQGQIWSLGDFDPIA